MTSAGEETAHILRDCMIFQKTHTTNLRDVRTLNMWGFELSNIDIISKLQNAETISLSLNNITSLEPFSYCKNLQNLYLRQNCISDLREVDYLCNLPRLTYLMLRDNPISSLPNYRSYIINKLPNLKKLDDIDVTMDDRCPSNDYSQTMKQPVHKSNDRESHSRINPSSSYSYQNNTNKSKTVGNYHYNNYNDADYSSEDDSSSNGGNNYQYQQKVDNNDPRRRMNPNNRINNNYNATNQNSYNTMSQNNYNSMSQSSYRASNNSRRSNTNSIPNYTNKPTIKKDDSNMLTAVLSLLPELTDDSLQVVLEAIEKQRNC